MPRQRATERPHAFNGEFRFEIRSRIPAASTSAHRIPASPHFEMPRSRLISPRSSSLWTDRPPFVGNGPRRFVMGEGLRHDRFDDLDNHQGLAKRAIWDINSESCPAKPWCASKRQGCSFWVPPLNHSTFARPFDQAMKGATPAGLVKRQPSWR